MSKGFRILDIKEFDLEFNTLISTAMKKHLFNWVYENMKKGVFVNKDQVKQLLVIWQQNIIENEQSIEH